MITGDFANGIHLMVGLSTDTKPETTSENTFFLAEDTGDVYYFSEGNWEKAPAAVGQFISNLLGGGSGGSGGGGGGGSNLLVVSLNSSNVPDTSSGDIYSAWQAGYIIKLRSSIGIEYELQHCTATKATFTTTINGTNVVIVDSYDIEGLTSTHYVLDGYVKPQGGIPATDMTSAVQAALAAAVPTVVTLTGSTPVIAEAQNNTIYEAGEVTSLTVQSVASGASFIVRFSSPDGTATALTMPSSVYMPSGFTVEPYGRCEINVADGYALAAFWPFDE